MPHPHKRTQRYQIKAWHSSRRARQWPLTCLIGSRKPNPQGVLRSWNSRELMSVAWKISVRPYRYRTERKS